MSFHILIAHFFLVLNNIGLAKKFGVFSKMTLVALVAFNSFKTILLDCVVIAVISVCIKKNIKIREFLCSHFSTEDGTYPTFWHIMIYDFKKGENVPETQRRDLCSVWRRCCD